MEGRRHLALVAAFMGQLRKEERTALLEALRVACPGTPDLSSHSAASLRSKRRTRQAAKQVASLLGSSSSSAFHDTCSSSS